MSELSATQTFEVTERDTAAALGSGSLDVLGTPRLLAWCEAVTCAAIAPVLANGSTSVGTRVEIDHQAASVVGDRLQVSASEVYSDNRLYRFTVSARRLGADGPGRVLASGEVTRVVVDVARFLARL